MKIDEVEPYVRKILKERFMFSFEYNAELRFTDPRLYDELCHNGIARAERDSKTDAQLREMCRIAMLDLNRLVAEEKSRALSRLDEQYMT